MKNSFIGKRDVCVLLITITVIAIIYFAFKYVFHNNGSMVKIEVDKKMYGTYDLNTNQEIKIFDEAGNVINIMVIKDGYADMMEATCPDKLCVHQKPIHKSKESIICLPHKVVVTIEGNQNEEFDAITN